MKIHSPISTVCYTCSPCIVACSPRKNGNSDAMAESFAQGVHSVGGNARILFLREYTIFPCTACYACLKHPEATCVRAGEDDTELLFATLLAAPFVFFASPIFFYHLPAQLKALVDRAHRFWVQHENMAYTKEVVQQRIVTPAMVGLVAARAQGDKLFEGSLLTLQYFFKALRMRLVAHHAVRQCDTPKDFITNKTACEHVYALGVRAHALTQCHCDE